MFWPGASDSSSKNRSIFQCFNLPASALASFLS